jgi:hypothetical protein
MHQDSNEASSDRKLNMVGFEVPRKDDSAVVEHSKFNVLGSLITASFKPLQQQRCREIYRDKLGPGVLDGSLRTTIYRDVVHYTLAMFAQSWILC